MDRDLIISGGALEHRARVTKMPHAKRNLAVDLNKLAPDVWELVRYRCRLNKKNLVIAKITADEWLELGQDVGVIGLDLLPNHQHMD